MELEKRGLVFTGTVQINRHGMPLAVKSTSDRQLQRGEVKAYRAGKAMVMQWKDKRVITLLTTSGTCNVVNVRTHRGQQKHKPAVVQLYNDNMPGVDKMDQLASYYAFLRKSVKWWRKVFFLPPGGICCEFVHCVHNSATAARAGTPHSPPISSVPHTQPGVSPVACSSATTTWSQGRHVPREAPPHPSFCRRSRETCRMPP